MARYHDCVVVSRQLELFSRIMDQDDESLRCELRLRQFSSRSFSYVSCSSRCFSKSGHLLGLPLHRAACKARTAQ